MEDNMVEEVLQLRTQHGSVGSGEASEDGKPSSSPGTSREEGQSPMASEEEKRPLKTSRYKAPLFKTQSPIACQENSKAGEEEDGYTRPDLIPTCPPPPPPPIIAQDRNILRRPTDPYGRPLPIYVTRDGKPILDDQGLPIPLKFNKNGKVMPLYDDSTPPPPPIIGPGGNILRRPTDSRGRPLPIYVTRDGKPILDDQGRLIPVNLNAFGVPMPLTLPPCDTQAKESKVPKSLAIFGMIDIIASLMVVAYAAYMCGEESFSASYSDDQIVIITTLAVGLLGAMCAGLPFLASKMNKGWLLPVWGLTSLIFLLVQGGVTFGYSEMPVGLTGFWYCVLRGSVFCRVTALLSSEKDTKPSSQGGIRWNKWRYLNWQGFPRQQQGTTPSTKVPNNIP